MRIPSPSILSSGAGYNRIVAAQQPFQAWIYGKELAFGSPPLASCLVGWDIIEKLLRSSLTRYMKSFRTKSSNFLTFSTAIRNFGQNPANFGHFPPYIFLLGHFPSKNFGQNPAKNFGHLPAVNFGQNHVIHTFMCKFFPYGFPCLLICARMTNFNDRF